LRVGVIAKRNLFHRERRKTEYKGSFGVQGVCGSKVSTKGWFWGGEIGAKKSGRKGGESE